MIIFYTSQYYEQFGKAFETKAGKYVVDQFPDGEYVITLVSDVQNEECLIIGSVQSDLDRLVLLADALKTNGATMVHALLPYLAYTRQDKFEAGRGSGVALLGRILRVAGIDRVSTFDIHSKAAEDLLDMPLVSLSVAPLFTQHLSRFAGAPEFCVVAPDAGALHRAELLAEALTLPLVRLSKKHQNGISHQLATGTVQKHALIVDDILATGTTLVSACALLKEHGCESIRPAITHGLFIGDEWKKIFKFGVSELFTTNTCPQAAQQTDERIKILDIYPLL